MTYNINEMEEHARGAVRFDRRMRGDMIARQIEGLLDSVRRHCVENEWVTKEQAFRILEDNLRDIIDTTIRKES